MAKEEQRGGYLFYSLFYQYASSAPADASYGSPSVSYIRMKELMRDMDLMEGVPPGLTDVFVREHLQRADQEGSGVISPQDFMLWLLTEVAALLPLRDAFCLVTGLRPLYNQFHAVLLGDVGFTDGARRPALGMTVAQLQRLVEEFLGPLSTTAEIGCSGSGSGAGSSTVEVVRSAFKAARASLGAFRASSGANTGAQMAEPAGGGRLQFAAFVRALAMLVAQRMGSLDAAVYQVVTCGVPLNLTDPRVKKPPLQHNILTSLGLSSQLEGRCSKESYNCDHCGQEHHRWRLDSWLKLEELLLSLGIPQPVRRFMPALPLINARNLRAAFHRYNVMYNKGKLPPASYRLPGEAAAGSPSAAVATAAAAAQSGGDHHHQREEDRMAGMDGAVGGRGGHDGGGGGGSCSGGFACCSQPAAYGACCCLFRSLSVMEMNTWLRLCSDCDAIREIVATHGSGVTPATLESTFVQASAIAGVYCTDDSSGIHDVPIPAGEGGVKLGLSRNSLGAVVGSEARAHPDHPPPKRSTAAYQAPPDGHPLAAAPTAASSGVVVGGPRLHEVQGPNSAARWLATARSLPYRSGGVAANAARGQQHRHSRLVLTFPQFLEALRLVAEAAGGHPTRTAAAERALLRLVHDVVRVACPRPDPTTATGMAKLRRQHLRSATAGAPQTQASSPPSSPPLLSPPSAPAASFSVTSTTTSTKYTYDDFTPPESDLYTSATSSRIGTRPALAANERNGGSGRALGPRNAAAATSTISSSTSTKYTYDDFTPPDSDDYTSATSSRVGSRSGEPQPRSLGNQAWRPHPVKTMSNLSASGGSSGGGGGGGKTLPSTLQPKRHVSATAATLAPDELSTWAVPLPLPPSARIRTTNAVSQGSIAFVNSNGGTRGRPSSAPRVRPQYPIVNPGADRVEYMNCSADATGGTVAGGGGGGGDERRVSRPRPVSAKQPGTTSLLGAQSISPRGGGGSGSGWVGLGSGGAIPGAIASAAIVSPPFAPRPQPASVSTQRLQSYTPGDAILGAKKSPPPPPPMKHPASAAAASCLTGGVWDAPVVSGQVRSRSPTKARLPSAAAVTADVRQANAGGGGGLAVVPKPFARAGNAPLAVAAAASTGEGWLVTEATDRTSRKAQGWRTSGAGQPPDAAVAGKGFVTPLMPVGGTATAATAATATSAVDSAVWPSDAALKAAAQAAMSADAAAVAALAAAAAARHSSLRRPPRPPQGGSEEQSSVTVHPITPPGDGADVKERPSASSYSSSAAAAAAAENAQREAPVAAGVPPSLQAKKSESGLRNLMLLQAGGNNPAMAAPEPSAMPAKSTSDNGFTPRSSAPTTATRVRRGDNPGGSGAVVATGSRRQSDAAAAVTPLTHVVLSYDTAAMELPFPIKLLPRSPSTGSGGGGAKGPPSLSCEETGGEESGRHWGVGIVAAAAQKDKDSSVAAAVDADDESTVALSPRAVLASALSAKAAGASAWGGRSRLPAEGTVNGLPQYFFA